MARSRCVRTRMPRDQQLLDGAVCHLGRMMGQLVRELSALFAAQGLCPWECDKEAGVCFQSAQYRLIDMRAGACLVWGSSRRPVLLSLHNGYNTVTRRFILGRGAASA